MKLYYNEGSFNSRRVLATVYALGLQERLELEWVDFMSDVCESEWFKKLNPNEALPVLVDGDLSLWEGNAILQYLCDVTPGQKLMPTDPKGRADVTRWLFWLSSHFQPPCSTLQWENVLKPMFGAGEANPSKVEEALAQFRDYADVLNHHVAQREWIVGSQLTIADLSIAATLQTHLPSKMPVAEFPHLERWFNRVRALECWKRSEPKQR